MFKGCKILIFPKSNQTCPNLNHFCPNLINSAKKKMGDEAASPAPTTLRGVFYIDRHTA